MPEDVLVVDDLLLLMLDDRNTVPAPAGTLLHILGGAVLVDLALAGRIEPEPGRGGLGGPVIRAVGSGPLPDRVLQDAYDVIADHPTRVQALLLRIGAALWGPVTYRLVRRGLVRRDRRRRLGPFRTTRFPSAGTAYERDLRMRVAAVLDEGVDPDPHLGAVIGLLSAGEVLPFVHPRPDWSGWVATRAKEIERGHWGAGAVNTVVTRAAADVAASSAAATAAVLTTTTTTTTT